MFHDVLCFLGLPCFGELGDERRPRPWYGRCDVCVRTTEAPMLYIGEQIGKAGENSVKVDIAVDPVDGTELVAKGLENAIAVVAVAPRGDLFHAPDMYMHKLAAGPKAKDAVHMDLPIEVNLRRLAKALNKEVPAVCASLK